MTDAEIIRAFMMRMEDASYDQIGDILHYSGDTVRDALRQRILSSASAKFKCPHPYVQRWMRGNCIPLKAIADRAGVNRRTISIQLKKPVIAKKYAKIISEMSGLTMEQVQATEMKEDHHG